MSAELLGDEQLLKEQPIPYGAVAWILKERPDCKGQFLANPRRHWQHYATRMSGPRAQLRTWRAWACYAIASRILPHSDFPHDVEQVENELLVMPNEQEIAIKLDALGLFGEAQLWLHFLEK